MGSEFWTFLSGLMVSTSGFYYAILVLLRLAPANPISWGVWGVVGTSVFVTSGTTFGMNAMTFNMVNPILVAGIAVWREFSQAEMPSRREIVGGTIGLMAIVGCLIARKHGVPDEWTLGLSIIADCVPLWPIVKNAYAEPLTDRPFPWILFAFGFGIGGFGLEKLSPFTLALPIYMFVGANTVAFPLLSYRLRHRLPIRQWF